MSGTFKVGDRVRARYEERTGEVINVSIADQPSLAFVRLDSNSITTEIRWFRFDQLAHLEARS